ncbi:uncharacterized protein LOC133554569 [Nerophis ophidion]|uniref:uncharacterized protein LOC133554569 n=1 Tax=Nerophis ophidion TaxID=159077 RepID=UPI002ADF4E8C|nr:uncharacterized protein LOC133554569 [Nerophis ophidion]
MKGGWRVDKSCVPGSTEDTLGGGGGWNVAATTVQAGKPAEATLVADEDPGMSYGEDTRGRTTAVVDVEVDAPIAGDARGTATPVAGVEVDAPAEADARGRHDVEEDSVWQQQTKARGLQPKQAPMLVWMPAGKQVRMPAGKQVRMPAGKQVRMPAGKQVRMPAGKQVIYDSAGSSVLSSRDLFRFTSRERMNIAADGGAGPPPGGHHDDRTSNPGIVPGRVMSEHSTPSNALMRCRRPFVMGTFNACSAREEARLIELTHCAEEREVEILGVQEHRRVHTDDSILYCRVERCTIISASAWRNEAQAAIGGVGLMLGPRARKALRWVNHHTDRILSTEFSGNPVTTVIVVYSPTIVAPSDVVEKFFEDLVRTVRGVTAHNFLAILGDFNARLGPEDAPFRYHDSTNHNGTYLTAFLMEHELLTANTIFRKRTGKRWTFRDRASGTLRQLDYILVRKKWRNSILNAEPYSTFSSVGSDHRVVSMRVRLSLRVPKPSPKIQYNWKAFSSDPGLQTRYAEEMRR